MLQVYCPQTGTTLNLEIAPSRKTVHMTTGLKSMSQHLEDSLVRVSVTFFRGWYYCLASAYMFAVVSVWQQAARWQWPASSTCALPAMASVCPLRPWPPPHSRMPARPHAHWLATSHWLVSPGDLPRFHGQVVRTRKLNAMGRRPRWTSTQQVWAVVKELHHSAREGWFP